MSREPFQTMEAVGLSAIPAYKEEMVRMYIYEHSEILGLGEIHGLRREGPRPAGGREPAQRSDGTLFRIHRSIVHIRGSYDSSDCTSPHFNPKP